MDTVAEMVMVVTLNRIFHRVFHNTAHTILDHLFLTLLEAGEGPLNDRIIPTLQAHQFLMLSSHMFVPQL